MVEHTTDPRPRPRWWLLALWIVWIAAWLANQVVRFTRFKNATAGVVTWWPAALLTVVVGVFFVGRAILYRSTRSTPEALFDMWWYPMVTLLVLNTILNAAPESILTRDLADDIGGVLAVAMLVWCGALAVWWYRDLRKVAKGEIDAYRRKREM